MLRKPTSYVSTTSESSEDDRRNPKRQVRMPVSNIQVRQYSENQPYTSTEGDSIAKSINTGNNRIPYLTRLRSRIPPASSNSDKSSTSETDDSVQPTLRASSDYDTGARSEEANDTNPERILHSLSLGSNSVQNNDAFEWSSDDSSNIQTRSLKRRKTSVINLASSTDSSDSGVVNQVRKALGKRTRLCTSSESSTSNDNSDEINVDALESMENESVSNLSRNSREKARITPLSERIRINQRLIATGQNQTPTLRQSRPSSSGQNSIIATNENRIPRTTRQTRTRPLSNENGVRPNMVRLRTVRSAEATSATSRNRVPATDRQNIRRSGARMQSNITLTHPTLRQNIRQNNVNSQNSSNASSSNIRRDSRPTTSRQINTRSIESRQNNVRTTVVTRARQNNRRTSMNGEIVQRTTTNPTSTGTLHRQNITLTGSPITTDPETGLSLTISIRGGQNSTYVRNPAVDSRERLDTDSSSGSSTDDMRPVLRRRRVILSSDNNTTSSDSEESPVNIRRIPARRRIQVVLSDNESGQEIPRTPLVTSDKFNETVFSDSDGESEKCPICFGRFYQQEIGTPKTCEHCFCLECIKKWAENNNTCPVDRRTFNSIIVRANFKGGVIREDVVPPPNNMALMQSDDSFLGDFSDSDSDTTDDLIFFDSDSDYETYHGLDLDTVDYDEPDEICNACMLSHDAEEMLPCNDCDNVYHLQCVDLQDIPAAWLCPDCVQAAID